MALKNATRRGNIRGRRYDAGFGLRSLDDVDTLLAFFEARRARLHAFRWKDWSDFKSCGANQLIAATDQPIGVGDGATITFQLKKTYLSGTASYVRPIAKPVAGTVIVAIANDPKVEGLEFSVDAATGMVSFTTAAGHRSFDHGGL